MVQAPVKVEVVVIGAGVSGAVAAHQCARAGLETLLVERRHIGRAKVCGCCVAPSGWRALDRLGLGIAHADAHALSVLDLSLEGRGVRLPMPGYRVQSRAVLDAAIARLACAAGARLVEGASARVIDVGEGRGARPAHVAFRRGDHEWRCDAGVVLACDGLPGASLAAQAAFAWTTAPTSRMGLGAIIEEPLAPIGVLRMACEARGYVGQVRLPDGRTCIAAAASAEAVRSAGSPGALAASILAGAGFEHRGVREASWRGTPALTRTRSRVALGRALAVGDAAGYVEPFTGEGMSWAIRSAEVAAWIAAGIVRGAEDARAWEAEHARLLRGAHQRCGWIARALRSSSVRSLVGLAGSGLGRLSMLARSAGAA